MTISRSLLFPVALLGLSVFSLPGIAEIHNPEQDLAAARTLFEANLEAIRHQDRDAYLACYLASEKLARNGPAGLQLGFEDFAAASGDGWPDLLEAQDLRLVPMRPGVVYGSYRYRVRYGEREDRGRSERIFVATPEGWRIAATTAFPDPPATPPPPRALVGMTLIDGTGAPPVADAAVVVRDRTVTCAGRREQCPVPPEAEIVDLTGLWMTPGLIDAHVHFSQTGWADGRPDSLDARHRYPYPEVQSDLRARPERWWRSYLCSGVTAVYDVGGYPWTWQLRERVRRDPLAPHLSVSGPLLSTYDFWLNLPAERQFVYLADPQAARDGVDYLVAHRTDAVKVWFIPVEDRDFAAMEAAVLAAGEAARERQVPLLVHATGLREATVAVRAGAHLLVHSVQDQPVDDEFVDLVLRQGTVYNPTLLVGRGYQRMYEAALSGQAPAVDDPNGCVDAETLARVAATAEMGDRLDPERQSAEAIAARGERTTERERIAAANLMRLHRAGVPIAMGTDAGNPLTLHGPAVYAEMEAMQAAGMSPLAVLVASTYGSALAMGRAEEIGTIAAGRSADLLVVAADPTVDVRHLRQVRSVVRGGEVRSIAELRAVRD